MTIRPATRTLTLFLFAALAPLLPAKPITYPSGDPIAKQANAAILEALPHQPGASIPAITLQLADATAELPPEGFEITLRNGAITVAAADSAGLLYGSYELAEQIHLYGIDGVVPTRQAPAMKLRGMKFNIPLDLRTPSYTDMSDAGQIGMEAVWDMEFWKQKIDTLSRHRYNFISLWNLHPFPSLVKVPEYPDVALDDVHRSRGPFEELYSLRTENLDAPHLFEDVEVLKQITIEEKIAFWREVMAYAKARNVAFYFITWNAYDYGIEGKYGINDSVSNDTSVDYFRASVRALFDTYPDLAGIGLTTGENMGRANFAEKEQWARDTYGAGVLDAVAAHPDRKIALVHRLHEADSSKVAEHFTELIEHPQIDFFYSFKYAKAHVHATTAPKFADAFAANLSDVETIYTLRNDDTYYLRWGSADYVREFLENIPRNGLRGMYYGSDGWLWARDFIDLAPDDDPQLDIEKHWYQWLLWGRLAYNPDLENKRLHDLLHFKHREADGKTLADAWHHASQIYPLVNRFHWKRSDFQWYIEACFSRPLQAKSPSGFHDIHSFINVPPHPHSALVSIPDYVAAVTNDKPATGTSPLDHAAQIHRAADQAETLLETLPLNPIHRELRATLEDIRATIDLGRYYAHKIEGATQLQLFRATGELSHQTDSIESMNTAAKHWRRYAASIIARYKNPLWLNRVGTPDLKEIYNDVLNDVRHAGARHPDVPAIDSTPGGKIYPVSEARLQAMALDTEISGYTGGGYARSLRQLGKPSEIEWTVHADKAGPQEIEIRYTLHRNADVYCDFFVNGQATRPIPFWGVESKTSWVTDRITVTLDAGKNTLLLRPHRTAYIDCLNVLP